MFAAWLQGTGLARAQAAPPPSAPAPAAFIATQKAIEVELRGGLTRLQSACRRKVSPATAAPGEDAAVKSRLAARAARLEPVERRMQQTAFDLLTLAKTSRAAACSPIQEALTLVSSRAISPQSACGVALSDVARAESMVQLAADYRAISSSRQAALTDLLRMEAQGCVRPGFSAQVLNTYESANAAVEQSVGGLVQQWTSAEGTATRPSLPGDRP